MEEFHKYEELRDRGLSTAQIYNVAQADGMNPITTIRMLRHVFQLSLVEAKEIIIRTKQDGMTLSSYQAKLLPELKQALDDEGQSC